MALFKKTEPISSHKDVEDSLERRHRVAEAVREMEGTPGSSSGRRARLRAAGAVAEVVGVFVVGHYVAGRLTVYLGIPLLGSAFASALGASRPDFVSLSWLFLRTLAVQYGCLLALGLALRRVHHGRGLSAFGLTLGGVGVGRSVFLGVAAFAAATLPFRLLLAAHSLHPLGANPPMWRLLEKPWTPAFWLFAATASFLVVAFLEELFYRGYCQSRLQEDLPHGQAVVVASLLFTLTHGQYHAVSVLAVGTVVSLFVIALALGTLYARTGSLLGCTVCHALVNLPVSPRYSGIALVLLVVLVVLLRRPVGTVVSWLLGFLGEAVRDRRATLGVASVVVGGVAFCFTAAPTVALVVGVVALAAAIVLIVRDKLRPLEES